MKRLLLGVLLLNVTVGLLAALSLQQSHRQYEQRAVVTTQNLAQALTQDLQATFDKIDLTVSTVKDEVERQLASTGTDKALLNTHVQKQLSRQPDLYSVRVASPHGEILYGTGEADTSGINVAKREFFSQLRANRNPGLVVSRPIVGQVSGKWSIVFARRIDNPDGSFAGVAFAVVLLEHLQEKFAKLDLGARGAVSLRDLELGTVVRQPEPGAIGSAVGNRTHSKEWPEKLRENPNFGTYFAVGLDGRNRALSFRRVAPYPFYVIVGLFPGDYLAEWQQELWKTLGLAAVFLILTCVFSWLTIGSWRKREADSRRLLELSQLALHQSEQQLELALDGAAMGVWAWKPDADAFSANAQAKRLHGLPADTAITKDAVLESISEEDRSSVRAVLDGPRSDDPLQVEFRTIRPTGHSYWLSWRGRWISGAAGTPQVMTGVVHDVTSIKRSEQRKDEFLAMLAHELRNPLAPIRNAVQIMRLSRETQVLERARSMMERQLENLVKLVEDLFDVSRISQGKLHLRTELIDIAAVIGNAVETCRPSFEAARHELKIDLPEKKILVDGDASRLAQVVSNMLTNAARYTPEGGNVLLHVEHSNETVSISVKDNGIGIPRDMLPHVFDMFAQIDQGVGKGQGLGIGLTLVKQLVELHGGSVRAFSEGRGRGSEFTVVIPAVSIEERATAPAPSKEEGPARPKVARRILIVDDNRDNAQSLAMMFQLMGHTTATAYDGEQAVESAAHFAPDVILLDIGLPKIDGFEAARRIRALPDGRSITLVALSGWAQEKDRRRSKEMGFDHYLVKPAARIDLEQLLE